MARIDDDGAVTYQPLTATATTKVTPATNLNDAANTARLDALAAKAKADADAAAAALKALEDTPTDVVPTDGRPALNNRNITPPDPGEGYRWQWISMAYANNKWGGEWRKVSTSSGGGGVGDGTQTTTQLTLVSTETDEYGNVVGIYSDGSTKILIPSGRKYKTTVDEDAYAILESTFKDFGLDDPDFLKEIQGYMERGLGSAQAGIELRKTKAYTTRFKGNEIRRAAGLNVLSEAEYLQLENSYNETLRAFGLQGYFGSERKAATAAMADIIGNDISAIEFKDRIDTVVTRVNNAEPAVKNTLNTFYNITDTDLVKYFLNPKENLPKLQEKVTAAEIGSAALGQGLLTDVARATSLAQLGVDKAEAQKGYAAIASVLPTSLKLGDIYKEEGIKYTQQTGEEEVFQELESAKRKRMKLAEKEIGSFSGAAGLGKGALGSGSTSSF